MPRFHLGAPALLTICLASMSGCETMQQLAGKPPPPDNRIVMSPGQRIEVQTHTDVIIGGDGVVGWDLDQYKCPDIEGVIMYCESRGVSKICECVRWIR